MDQDELEALQAIYGDELVEVVEDNVVRLTVSNTEGNRVMLLTITCGADYPEKEPGLQLEGRKSVQNEQILRLKKLLAEEATLQLGMPMMFALAERAKSLLDDLDANTAETLEKEKEEEEARRKREAKGLNHQVGNPLITDGRRCTEEVFQEWREGWLEKRALRLAQRAAEQQAAYDGKPTGKAIFLAQGVNAGEDQLAKSALAATVATGAVDESLFQDDVDDVSSDE